MSQEAEKKIASKDGNKSDLLLSKSNFIGETEATQGITPPYSGRRLLEKKTSFEAAKSTERYIRPPIEVIDPVSAQVIQDTISDELGAENLVSIGLFGSTTRGSKKRHSDYDFTIILNHLPDDIYQREEISPRLKRRLHNAGLQELCAFNLYTKKEFEAADAKNSWLLETMKTGYSVLYDRDNFLSSRFAADKPEVRRVGPFAWMGVNNEDETDIRKVLERHTEVAVILQTIDPAMADYHTREAQRGKLKLELLTRGVFVSRDSLFGLEQRLKKTFRTGLDIKSFQREDFMQEMRDKRIIYGYDQTERHLQAAKALETAAKPLDSLFHTYVALRNIYLHTLHTNEQYLIDGEVTQLFLKQFDRRLPSDLVNRIYKNSFKAEQILGRSEYISFDLDENGKSIYEDPSASNFDYTVLLTNLRGIIEDLQEQTDSLMPHNFDEPTISIVITATDRPGQLDKCIKSVNNLIFPEGKIELIVHADSHPNSDILEQLRRNCKFPIKIISQEEGDSTVIQNKGLESAKGKYIAFLEENSVVSPLWLIQLMSGFIDDTVVGVTSTMLEYPTDTLLNNDGLSVKKKEDTFASPAIIRRDILEEVRDKPRPNMLDSNDVELGLRFKNEKYQLKHVDGAIGYI